MNSMEWLKDNLEGISNIFECLQIKYVFDDLSNTHFVYISPDTILSDDLYLKEEKRLRLGFIESYGFESLCFLTIQDIISSDNMEVIYEHHPTIAGVNMPINSVGRAADNVVFTSESINMNVHTASAVEVQKNFLIGNDYTEFEKFTNKEQLKIINIEMAA